MPRKRSHSKKDAIPQKLLDEASRFKKQGIKIKQTLFNRDGPDKLSQAIITLVAPYEEMGRTYPAYHTLIALACLAWNAAQLDEPERSEMVRKAADAFKDKTDAQGLLEFHQFTRELVERKLHLFPNDRRYVVNFEVTESEDNYHVFVTSLTP